MLIEEFTIYCQGLPRDHKGCWLWNKAMFSNGYPSVQIDGCSRRGNRVMLEHKLDRKIKKGYWSLHTCDEKGCLNPDHLYEGTQAQNVYDSKDRNRFRRGDQHPSRIHPDRWSRGDNHYSRTHPEKLARGEKHGCAKLNPPKIRTIRKLWARGWTTRKLSNRYKVSRRTICRIIYENAWGQVQ